MKNPHRLPTHVKPERYEILIKPDLEEFSFTGEETIYLSLEKPAKEIVLHCVELKIECEGVKITYDEKQETAKLTFPKEIDAGKHELKLKFKGILNDKMRGFYRSKFGDKHLAVTQFEATDARRAFPCFDEPSHKAIFDVTLMIPGHMSAISNTIESSVREHESGYKIVEFEPTPKMSTYLLAFIVGEFEYLEGKAHTLSLRKQGSINNIDIDSRLRGNDKETLVRVFTTPGKKEQAKFALEVAKKCLEFYENYFDIDYPLPVLDLIAIPDFASGAMENWGAVTYRESTLLIDGEKSSSANKQWVALVIAHELVHQWFGNLVTMEWWTHLWLNEGFASFIEYLAIDHIFPEWDIWTQFVAQEMGEAFELDSLKNTHPIEVEVGHPAEISEIFDKVSYSKGASILRMLWQYLGPKTFQKGLQHYLKRHSYANAKTEDLWRAMEEISGKPVASVMKNWTSKPGHPMVRVQGTGDSLKLTQNRFFISPISKKETRDQTVWSIPLDGILMDKKNLQIPNRGNKLNLGETGFLRIDYPKNYLAKLTNLSAPDRLGLVRDSFDLAQSGDSPTTLAMDLALSYIDEEDYTVWSQLTGHISQLDSLLSYESFYKNFRDYGKQLYTGIAKKMGWEKRAGEKHTDSLLRGMVLYQLGKFGELGIIKKAQELFSQVIDPDLRGVVYNLVASSGGDKEFNTLIRMYKEEDHQQEKDRIGRSLGLFKQKNLLQKTLEFAISKHVRFQNTLGIISSVWGNPVGRYLAWEFVKKNWKLLKERYAGGHYFTRVFEPAGEFTKISDVKDIEKFVAKNPIPEAKRTIAQVIERIYSNEDWLKRDKQKIKKFLNQEA